MSDIDKTTIKTRAIPGGTKNAASPGNLTEIQEKSLELANKNAQLEEVKGRLLDHLKTIEQLRENLGQEQARTAEMAEKAVMLETREKELAKLEIRVKAMARLESEAKKVPELEARVKELSGLIEKIANLAAEGKTN